MEQFESTDVDSSVQSWMDMQQADWYFRKAVRKFIKERDKISVEGIPLPCILILRKIERDGPCHLGALAEEMDFTSGAITGMCDRLEKSEYASRIRQQTDRRTVLLSITPKGKQFTARYREVGVRCITALFAGLHQEELRALARILPKIIENLDTFSRDVLKTADTCSRNQGTASELDGGSYLHY